MTGWREEDSAVCLKISSFLRYYLRVPRQLRDQYDITRKKILIWSHASFSANSQLQVLALKFDLVLYSGHSHGELLLEDPSFGFFCLFFF